MALKDGNNKLRQENTGRFRTFGSTNTSTWNFQSQAVFEMDGNGDFQPFFHGTVKILNHPIDSQPIYKWMAIRF